MTTLCKVAENVWEAVAPLKLPGIRMDHRMTVLLLESGEVLVHSPIAYSRELADSIQAIGRPTWFVAPSRYHDMYWPEWFQAFPGSKFVAAQGVKEDHPDLPFSHVLGNGTDYWDGEVVSMPLRGIPKLNEVALLHSRSRSLLVADLFFNLDAKAQTLVGRLFMRVNGIYREPGISRIFRTLIKDRIAFADSLKEIQAHSFERMIIGHGPNLGGNEALQRAMVMARFA